MYCLTQRRLLLMNSDNSHHLQSINIWQKVLLWYFNILHDNLARYWCSQRKLSFNLWSWESLHSLMKPNKKKGHQRGEWTSVLLVKYWREQSCCFDNLYKGQMFEQTFSKMNPLILLSSQFAQIIKTSAIGEFVILAPNRLERLKSKQEHFGWN